MNPERDLLKKILATGWLNNTISCEVEELLAQPEQPEPVYWENEKKALLNEIDHLTNRLAQPELSTDSLQLDEQDLREDLREGLREDLREGLRDHFAGLAMQAIISKHYHNNDASARAYEYADAMLKAREVGDE